MRKLLSQNHPFRLLLYLEWILLGIAVLAVFSPLLVPHPPRVLRLHPLRVRFPLAAAASIVTLGLMGLGLPVKSRLLPGIIYTSLGFVLSWVAVMLGGRGGSVFPPLLLVVVIRACVMFPWSGRLLVAGFAYVSFLLMQLMSFLEIRPLGVSLARPLPRAFRRMPSELLQGIIINFTLSSALLFGLVLVFVLLLVGAVLSEHKSRQELAYANDRLRQYALLIENQATLQERNRIAREIHDSVGHSLAAQSIQLENVAMLLPEDHRKLAHHLHKARQLGKEALQHVRQSVATLRNHPLQGQSLPTAINKLLKEFEATNCIQLNTNIGLTSSLSAEIAIALYRVTQEALTNISKHSHANQVRLHLIESTRNISLLLEDNGRGFDPNENTTGFGLKGMRERTEALGGSFSLTSQPGKGCQIEVDIPLSGLKGEGGRGSKGEGGISWMGI